MTQTVTVTQASIADLIEQRDVLLGALKELFADYKGLADSGDAGFWRLENREVGKRTLAAIAKASPIAGLTEIGGCDE